MKKFKVEVSKNAKKYTLVFNSENEIIARDRVHKEGYSILNVTEIGENDITGNKFIFSGEKNGEIKKGMIVGNDILKVYIKLVESFNYNINLIYPEDEKNITLEEKKRILKEIKEQYFLFSKNKNKNVKLNKLREKSKREKSKKENSNHEDFHLKKELDETYKLIVFILKKIKTIIEGKGDYELSIAQKEKFKLVYNEIIKLKKTTNLAKLKEIGELALIKVGRLEVMSLDLKRSEQQSFLLKETNELLKKIGSKKHFIEKRKNIIYIINSIYLDFKSKYFKKNKKIKKIKLDKTSYSYLKTLLLISKYKKRLDKNSKEIYKNIFFFIFPFGKNKEKKDYLLIKRKVIKQNILLLSNKIFGIRISYTRLKNNFIILYKKLNKNLIIFRQITFKITIFYTSIFLIYITYSYYVNNYIYINYKGLFYFIILLGVYLATLFSRGFFTLILNFVILFFIITIGIINF